MSVKKCDACGYEDLNVSHFCYLSGGKVATLVDSDLLKDLREEAPENQAKSRVTFVCYRCAGEKVQGKATFYEHEKGGPQQPLPEVGVFGILGAAEPGESG